MKKILISLSVIGVVAAIVIGATTAYFSDTETSEGNTLTAGTLDLSVNDENPLEGPVVTIEDLKPSQVHYSEPITLVIHDNPGYLWKHIKVGVEDTGIVTEPECTEQGGNWVGGDDSCEWGTSEDQNNIQNYTWFDLEIWVDEDDDDQIDEGEWKILIPGDIGKVSEFTSCWIPLGESGPYEPGTRLTIRQSFHLDKDVTNWAQGDSYTFGEEFMVTQVNAPHPEPLCLEYPITD